MAVEGRNPDNSLLLHLRRRSHGGYLVQDLEARCRRSWVVGPLEDCERPFLCVEGRE